MLCCVQASASCAVTVGNAVQTLQQKGFGIDWQQMALSLTAGGQTITTGRANGNGRANAVTSSNGSASGNAAGSSAARPAVGAGNSNGRGNAFGRAK